MGISDGIHAFKTNREEALKITAAFLKAKQGPALDAAYDSFTKYVYPDIPRPSLKGIALVLAELKTKVPAAGGFKPEQLVYTAPFDPREGRLLRQAENRRGCEVPGGGVLASSRTAPEDIPWTRRVR